MITTASSAPTMERKLEKSENMPVLTRFKQQFFKQRLQQVFLRTGDYENSLNQAWGKIEDENQERRPLMPHESSEESPPSGHTIELVKRICNAGIRSIVLEASHAYTYHSMDDEELRRSMEIQYSEARNLEAALKKQRISVKKVLFIDNYNAHPVTGEKEDNLDIDAYESFASAHGFQPDYLLWESDMAPIATAMINFMQQYQSLVAEKESSSSKGLPSGKKLVLAHRGVDLLSTENNKVSCAALDTALSLVKYKYLGEGIVNILPKKQEGSDFSFRGQQKKVRQILTEHLGVRVMPYFNIFTSEVESLPHSAGFHHAFRKNLLRI